MNLAQLYAVESGACSDDGESNLQAAKEFLRQMVD